MRPGVEKLVGACVQFLTSRVCFVVLTTFFLLSLSLSDQIRFLLGHGGKHNHHFTPLLVNITAREINTRSLSLSLSSRSVPCVWTNWYLFKHFLCTNSISLQWTAALIFYLYRFESFLSFLVPRLSLCLRSPSIIKQVGRRRRQLTTRAHSCISDSQPFNEQLRGNLFSHT